MAAVTRTTTTQTKTIVLTRGRTKPNDARCPIILRERSPRGLAHGISAPSRACRGRRARNGHGNLARGIAHTSSDDVAADHGEDMQKALLKSRASTRPPDDERYGLCSLARDRPRCAILTSSRRVRVQLLLSSHRGALLTWSACGRKLRGRCLYASRRVCVSLQVENPQSYFVPSLQSRRSRVGIYFNLRCDASRCGLSQVVCTQPCWKSS